MANFKLKRNSIPLQVLASGDRVELVSFHAKGDGQGPSAYLQAGLHGAEVQGNLVIFELFRALSDFSIHGDLTFIPHANPYAMNQRTGEFTQGRFSPTTGDNWNRMFWRATCRSETERLDEYQIALDQFLDQEKSKPWPEICARFRALMVEKICARKTKGVGQGGRLALALQERAAQADIVLDLHCASVSLPHVYAPVCRMDSAKELLFPFYLAIPEEYAGALDESSFLPWFDLVSVAKERGIVGAELVQESFTVELGDHESISTANAKDSAERILHYLVKRGVVSEKPGAQNESRFKTLPRPRQLAAKLADYEQVFLETGGLWEPLAPLGKELRQGAPLYRVLRMREVQDERNIEAASQEVNLAVDSIPLVRASSSIAHSGDEIFRVLTNYYSL